MTSLLNDLSCVHDNDLVGVSDCGEPMSDDHDSLITTLDKAVQSLLHLMLTLGI